MPTHRSSHWYAGSDRNAYIHRAWMRRGLPSHAFDGRPHIAIANTASDLTPCNAHLNEVAESVKQGVYEAGGIPMNLPVVSLGETNVRPTAMLWRNMAAMAAEEMFRANPIDGLVLLGGCDKTIPALLMAAASVDLPAIVVPGGPMLSGTFRGVALGCGTDVWKLSEEVRAGTLSRQDFLRSESSMIRSRGHCNTMGTASTMAVMAESLGTTIPGLAGTPAADSRLLEAAHAAGVQVIEMVAEDRRPSTLFSRGSFLNAIVALAAVGGSTNAVIHLLAIAGRLGIELTPGGLRPRRVLGAAPGRSPARRALPHGGLPPRGRSAGGAAGGLRPPGPRRADGHRPAAGRVSRRRRDLGPRGHPDAVRAAAGRGRHRRPARQPRPHRRGDQAGGGVAGAAAAIAGRPWSSTRSRTSMRASTIPT